MMSCRVGKLASGGRKGNTTGILHVRADGTWRAAGQVDAMTGGVRIVTESSVDVAGGTAHLDLRASADLDLRDLLRLRYA